jgi:Ca-activated chloride channel family protein
LSIRYGIVTPYTSYLVTEEMPLGEAERARIAGEQFNDMATQPAAPAYGQQAVEKAAEQGALSGADSAAELPVEAASSVRIVGSRAFVLADGVWIDTAFDPEAMQTEKVAFLSDDYFALAAARPELAAAFALGERVIALSDGVAYEVVGSGEPADSLDIPPTPTPATEPDVFPQATPVSPDQPSVPGTFPCVAGLIPLTVLPFAMLLVHLLRRLIA